MTPAEFHAAYRPCADQVSAGTGIDPIALLAQWANETAWGTFWAGAPYNLGNIRNGPGGLIVTYASLDVFAVECASTFHNGYYGAVLAADNAIDQLDAIVASPWSIGHYGGSLMGYYTPLEGFELTPEEHGWLKAIYNAVTQEFTLQRVMTDMGTPNPPVEGGLVSRIASAVGSGSGGGTEPPEPAEPTKITGVITGTISGNLEGTLT